MVFRDARCDYQVRTQDCPFMMAKDILPKDICPSTTTEVRVFCGIRENL